MPRMQMVINNNNFRGYKQQTTTPSATPSPALRPRLNVGGAMIGRIQFAKSGCSACGK